MLYIPYTYLIKHKESEKLYHGSRTAKGCNPNELLTESGYITSSQIVKNIINKEGLDSFEIINIETFITSEEARLAEEMYHKEYDVEGNVCYFNRHNAGGKFFCTGHSEETRKKLGTPNNKHMLGKKHSKETLEKFKYRKYSSGEDHYLYGKKRPEEITKKAIATRKERNYTGEKSCWFGKSGEGTPNYGNKHSDEAKLKISKANKGRKHSEETRKNMSQSRKGKKQDKIKCPHCNKEGGNVMKRYHFDNCKYLLKNQEILKPNKLLICPHCNKEGDVMNMKRWHFDNCKHKIQEAA